LVVVFPWAALVEYDQPYVSKNPVVWLDPPAEGFAQQVLLSLVRNGTLVTG